MSQHNSTADTAKLNALTSMRFFAAMMIVVLHYAWFFPGRIHETTLIRMGSSGVTFFFMLSGFILAYTYANIDFSERGNVRRFYIARFSRIYPVYLLSLASGLPAYLAYLKAALPPGQVAVAAASILAPLGIQSWVPGAGCALNCPSWSISTEAFFYACFPFLLPLILRRPRLWFMIALVAWTAIELSYLRLWAMYRPSDALFNEDLRGNFLPEFVKFFPPGRLPEFILGIVLFAFTRRVSLPAALYLGVAGLGFLVLGLTHMHIPNLLINNGITAFAYAPLILAGAAITTGLLVHPWLVYLGQISFALYLLHGPAAALIERLDRRLFNAVLVQDYPMARALISTAVALAAAAIVYRFVEDPMRRFLRDRLADKGSVPAIKVSAA